MVADPTKPTRAQLSRISNGDNRLLLALERLFEVSGQETPDDLTLIAARVLGLEQDVSTDAAALEYTNKIKRDLLTITDGIEQRLPDDAAALEHANRIKRNLEARADGIEQSFGLDPFSAAEPLRDITRGLSSGAFVFVSDKADFPAPSSGVITLAGGVTYFLTGEIDLAGDRLVCGPSTVILGGSSENARLKSTGLTSGTALVTSEWSLPLRNITLEAATIFDLDASANPNQALDWAGVNLSGSSDIGTIADYNNFVATSMAFLGVSGLVFDGTFGTIAFESSLFVGTDPGTIITLPSTLTVSRRFRIIYSSVVATGSGVALDVNASAVIPVEGYILDTVVFSGGGTYTNGVQYDDNKALFVNCTGIRNSASAATYYMQNNATATTIAATNTPVKIAGTTTSGALTQRFAVTDNRATYSGEVDREFRAMVTFSFTCTNPNTAGIYIAKNGTVITESAVAITAPTSGRVENGVTFATVDLVNSDYIEVWIENRSAVRDFTVTDLNFTLDQVT